MERTGYKKARQTSYINQSTHRTKSPWNEELGFELASFLGHQICTGPSYIAKEKGFFLSVIGMKFVPVVKDAAEW